MTDMQQIFTEYGPQYLDQYKDRIPKNHINAIEAITACRSADAGIVDCDWAGCGHVHVNFRSCGNRHRVACKNVSPFNGKTAGISSLLQFNTLIATTGFMNI